MIFEIEGLTFSEDRIFESKEDSCWIIHGITSNFDKFYLMSISKSSIENSILNSPINYEVMTDNQKKIWSQYQIFVQLISNAFPKPHTLTTREYEESEFIAAYREEGLHKRYKGLKQLWDEFHEGG